MGDMCGLEYMKGKSTVVVWNEKLALGFLFPSVPDNILTDVTA